MSEKLWSVLDRSPEPSELYAKLLYSWYFSIFSLLHLWGLFLPLFWNVFYLLILCFAPHNWYDVLISFKVNSQCAQWTMNSEQWTMINDSGWKYVHIYEMLSLYNFLHRNKYWQKKSENDVLSSRSRIHGQVINLPTTLKLIGEALSKVRSPMPPTYISLCILVWLRLFWWRIPEKSFSLSRSFSPLTLITDHGQYQIIVPLWPSSGETHWLRHRLV